ncbi:hypothetical protein V2J09_014154 [Rumex salicifolius]
MLGVFSSSVVSPPEELVAAGSRTPSPKTKAGELMKRFLKGNPSAMSVQVGDDAHLAFTHHNESPLFPRSFAVKDEILCLFSGALDNLGSLRQQYGLAKSATEVVLVIEAYKTLRDRAPYPASHVVGHLHGNFSFILLKGSCGKSLASFPQGCFFSTALGGLRCFENPKNRITAIPADEDEIWGATYKVEGPVVLAATK